MEGGQVSSELTRTRISCPGWEGHPWKERQFWGLEGMVQRGKRLLCMWMTWVRFLESHLQYPKASCGSGVLTSNSLPQPQANTMKLFLVQPTVRVGVLCHYGHPQPPCHWSPPGRGQVPLQGRSQASLGPDPPVEMEPRVLSVVSWARI